MLVEIETDSEDYRGDLAKWLETANLDRYTIRDIKRTLETADTYELEDETHSVYLRITKVDLSVYG